MYAFDGEYTMKRGFLMDLIVARIYKILKETGNLIEFEKQIQLLMHETFTKLVGDVFNQINPIIKKQKQDEN